MPMPTAVQVLLQEQISKLTGLIRIDLSNISGFNITQIILAVGLMYYKAFAYGSFL